MLYHFPNKKKFYLLRKNIYLLQIVDLLIKIASYLIEKNKGFFKLKVFDVVLMLLDFVKQINQQLH